MKSFFGGRQTLALLLAAGQTAAFSVIPVFAAGNSVTLGGAPIFSVNSGVAGQTAEVRADKIQHNIDNSLVASSDHGPSSVKITYVKGVPVITLGGYLVTTVDVATAKAAGTTPSLLAQKWANALRTALSNKNNVNQYIAQITGSSYSSAGTLASSNSGVSTLSKSASKPASTTASKPASKIASKPVAKSSPKLSSAPTYKSMPTPVVADAGSTTPFSSPSPASSSGAYDSSMPADTAAYQPSTSSFKQGRVVYIPAGMQISAQLSTSLSSGVARAGDLIMAKTTESIDTGGASIPPGSVLLGQVTEATTGKRLAKSGSLGIKFTSMRTPDGTETPISAHLSSGVSKYSSASGSSEKLRGENAMSKVKKAAVASAIGAGAGAVLGLTVGGIAGGGRGVGRGAWSGLAIGAGLGLAQSLLLRKGADVNLMQGEVVKLQLDAPVSLAMGG